MYVKPMPTREQLLEAADRLRDTFAVGIPSIHFGQGLITISQYHNMHGMPLNPKTDPIHWTEAQITYAMAMHMLGEPISADPEALQNGR